MPAPTPEDVRRSLAGLDTRDQKIVAGLLGVMLQNATRVREREWVARQLAQMTVLAGGFEAESPDAGVRAVHAFLQANAARLLAAALLLFQRLGLDLAPRAERGFTFEEALRMGLAYLPSISFASSTSSPSSIGGSDDEPSNNARDANPASGGRDLGRQPLAGRMAERGLTPADLVAASDEQLTHKMVARAMKGRRLTANTMGKVLRAWNRASASDDTHRDLFDYAP